MGERIKMPTCSFCKKNYDIPRGLTIFQLDGTAIYFCSSKCRRNFKLKRDPKKTNWVKRPVKVKEKVGKVMKPAKVEEKIEKVEEKEKKLEKKVEKVEKVKEKREKDTSKDKKE